MNNTAKWPLESTRNPSQVAELAAWLAILATGATIFLLVSLHALSPEFSPSWRVISEYAFGHYAWVLSLMFLSWSIGSWSGRSIHDFPEADFGTESSNLR